MKLKIIQQVKLLCLDSSFGLSDLKTCSLVASFCLDKKKQEMSNISSKTFFIVSIQGENEDKIIHVFNSNMKVTPSVALGSLPRLYCLSSVTGSFTHLAPLSY